MLYKKSSYVLELKYNYCKNMEKHIFKVDDYIDVTC